MKSGIFGKSYRLKKTKYYPDGIGANPKYMQANLKVVLENRQEDFCIRFWEEFSKVDMKIRESELPEANSIVLELNFKGDKYTLELALHLDIAEKLIEFISEFLRLEEKGLILQENQPPAGFEPATW
ncbi:hypothetical protein DRP05_01690 [Archaeoglobales archaeon]|nr:MAG: hypothetical protein DRP05_01690 [Archaeoglobales archaeon]